MPPKGTSVVVKRKHPPYAQSEDNIIIAGKNAQLSWAQIAEKLNVHHAANNTDVTRSRFSARQRWTLFLEGIHGSGAQNDAGSSGEEQGEDGLVEEQESGQAEEREVGGEGSKELDFTTNKHNHELDSLKEKGLDAEEEPQILREASSQHEMERYAAAKRLEGGD
ncbi:hypothetical protein FKW77_008766 [Venturia effusa]|uniref:Uncharacterized protein n=1 Tax=Venturia effusa TaxID=50376 RepID=A0A517LEF1_9PEZI|nr:hypothetical protein FKW77_008766 [Venturia effusa]